MIDRQGIFKEIDIERDRQDRRFGGEDHDDGNSPNEWIVIIMKHLGRAVHWPWTVRTFRHQMVRVAALAVAAVEWADRDGEGHEAKTPKG